MHLTRPTLIRPLVAFALGLVLAQPVGCSDSNDSDARIASACHDYCETARMCNDEIDMDNCQANCEDGMNDCMHDELPQALDDLENCAAESCDDFLGCSIGAGLQCTFGI
jgi:hypothetical protein